MGLFPDSITDCHTHVPGTSGAIINVAPGEPRDPSLYYSVGIHPWMSGTYTPEDLERLAIDAAAPEVLAVGECGLDKLRGADMETQIRLLEHHNDIAERVGKPLIVHCVRAWGELLGLRRAWQPSQPWVIHGFRGKPELARQLVDAGCYISLGKLYNPGVPGAVPPDRILHETDALPEQ